MAFAFVTEFPIQGDAWTTTIYNAVNERLTTGDAPEGLLLHYARFDKDTDVFRIVNVWDTRAQGQAYLDDRVMPTVREVMGADGVTPFVGPLVMRVRVVGQNRRESSEP